MPGDRTNNLQISAIYQLPFGKGKTYLSGGLPAAIAGGWQFNTIASYYSGSPFGISAPDDTLNSPDSPQQADQVKPDVAIYGARGLAGPYFDTTAFNRVTASGVFGTAHFDSLRGPGFANMDAGLFRTFDLHEWLHMQFRAEAFNLTNHPNFNNPDSGVTDGQFGLINGTNAGSRLVAERYFRVTGKRGSHDRG